MKLHFEKFESRHKHCLVSALTVRVLAVPKARYLASCCMVIFCENDLETFGHYRVNVTLLTLKMRHLELIFILT